MSPSIGTCTLIHAPPTNDQSVAARRGRQRLPLCHVHLHRPHLHRQQNAACCHQLTVPLAAPSNRQSFSSGRVMRDIVHWLKTTIHVPPDTRGIGIHSTSGPQPYRSAGHSMSTAQLPNTTRTSHAGGVAMPSSSFRAVFVRVKSTQEVGTPANVAPLSPSLHAKWFMHLHLTPVVALLFSRHVLWHNLRGLQLGGQLGHPRDMGPVESH